MLIFWLNLDNKLTQEGHKKRMNGIQQPLENEEINKKSNVALQNEIVSLVSGW